MIYRYFLVGIFLDKISVLSCDIYSHPSPTLSVILCFYSSFNLCTPAKLIEKFSYLAKVGYPDSTEGPAQQMPSCSLGAVINDIALLILIVLGNSLSDSPGFNFDILMSCIDRTLIDRVCTLQICDADC